MTRIARLDSRALISVSGDEARPFLNNLLTQDVETLADGSARALVAAIGCADTMACVLTERALLAVLNWLADAAGVLIAGVLLWDVLFRGQIGFSICFLEEMWSRNLGHLFVSPLRPWELVASLMTMSLIRTSLGAGIADRDGAAGGGDRGPAEALDGSAESGPVGDGPAAEGDRAGRADGRSRPQGEGGDRRAVRVGAEGNAIIGADAPAQTDREGLVRRDGGARAQRDRVGLACGRDGAAPQCDRCDVARARRAPQG